MAVITGVLGVRLVIPLGLGPGSDELALDAVTVALLIYLGLQGGFLAGLLGVGGGVIAIAVLVAFTGTSQVLAQGIALTATIPTVVVGALVHQRQGTLAPRAGLAVGLVGMAFAVPGALVAFAVPVGVLRTVFGVFLLIGSYRMFLALRRDAGRGADAAVTARKRRGTSCQPTVNKGPERWLRTHPERRPSCSPATRRACSSGWRRACRRASCPTT